MLRKILGRREARLLSAGEKARRLHSAWLTRALVDPGRFPRIPARKVSEGGFSMLMKSQRGRAWAEGWWGDTLDGME